MGIERPIKLVVFGFPVRFDSSCLNSEWPRIYCETHRETSLLRGWRSASPRRKKLVAGFNPQCQLLASMGTKDPKALDILNIETLAAPDTINTAPA